MLVPDCLRPAAGRVAPGLDMWGPDSLMDYGHVVPTMLPLSCPVRIPNFVSTSTPISSLFHFIIPPLFMETPAHGNDHSRWRTTCMQEGAPVEKSRQVNPPSGCSWARRFIPPAPPAADLCCLCLCGVFFLVVVIVQVLVKQTNKQNNTRLVSNWRKASIGAYPAEIS